MLCDVLISVLRSARADLNAQFAQAKREHPALDDTAFTGFIEQQIESARTARTGRSGL